MNAGATFVTPTDVLHMAYTNGYRATLEQALTEYREASQSDTDFGYVPEILHPFVLTRMER